jgi:serine/threonine protein kinase
MGLLYRGIDLTLGRAVAIKLLARHLITDKTANARFVQEARAASALDHPNIASVYDIGEEGGELFIVMALYDGETLKQRLEKGRLAVDEAVEILGQVVLGLEAACRIRPNRSRGERAIWRHPVSCIASGRAVEGERGAHLTCGADNLRGSRALTSHFQATG